MVTASWKCSSESGCAVLFENANSRLMEGSLATVRLATMSIFKLVLLTTALCSLGSEGASGGSAEEKFHSSSSLAATGWAGAAGLGESDASAANGSAAGDWEGGEKADLAGGCGVADCDPGAEAKEEKFENGAGDDMDVGT